MASATSWAGNDLLQLFQSIVIELAHIFQILFLLDFQQLGLQLLHDLGIALRIGLGFFLNGSGEFVGLLLSFLRRAGSRREGGGGQEQGAGQQERNFFSYIPRCVGQRGCRLIPIWVVLPKHTFRQQATHYHLPWGKFRLFFEKSRVAEGWNIFCVLR